LYLEYILADISQIMSKKLGQGTGPHSQTKQVIANVYNYLKRLADTGDAVKQYVKL
jgi:hypothetical protein